MLRINLELVPFGEENNKRSLGEMIIGNVGQDDEGTYSYVVFLNKEEIGNVHRYERSKGPWQLVQQAIELLPPEKKKGL